MDEEQIKGAETQANENTEIIDESTPQDVAGGQDNGTPETNVDTDIAIPDNWEQPIKDFLNSIADKGGRKAVFDKIKNLDDGYQKKFSTLSNDRKKLDDDIRAFSDERALLGQYAALEKQLRQSDVADAILEQFGTIPNYIQRLHQLNTFASRNPARFIVDFCRSAGINNVEQLEQLLNSNEANQYRAQSAASQLQRSVAKQIQDAITTERKRTAMQAQVEAFAKDANHPYFEQLRPEMAKLAQAMPGADLEDLYYMALRRNPALQAQAELDAQKAARAAEIAELEKAKAARGVVSTPAAKTIKQEHWQDWLKQQIDNDVSVEDY